MTGAVAPLHGALAAQGGVLPKTTAHLAHSRLLRASRASAKTATWADLDEARMGRVVMWKRLMCPKHEPQVVNVLGLRPLLMHDVKVQEKRGVAAAVGAGLGPVWFIGGGGCGRQMRALVRTLLPALCWMLS